MHTGQELTTLRDAIDTVLAWPDAVGDRITLPVKGRVKEIFELADNVAILSTVLQRKPPAHSSGLTILDNVIRNTRAMPLSGVATSALSLSRWTKTFTRCRQW